MKNYWEIRYNKEGKIWGTAPSTSAKYALKIFRKNDINSIFVPGSGYGRNTRLFSHNGYKVIGIEISESAFQIAKKYDTLTKFYNASVLDIPLNDEIYDAIYCFNTLHLFLKKERLEFINKCNYQLKNNGLLFFVVFSEKEKSFGRGKKVEENSFESKPGRPVHYFTKRDLINHFENFIILETGIIEDNENHGEIGKHTHILRYILAKKFI